MPLTFPCPPCLSLCCSELLELSWRVQWHCQGAPWLTRAAVCGLRHHCMSS